MTPATQPALSSNAASLRASLPPWLLVLFAVLAVVMFAFPQIDLAASRVLTDASGTFPLQHDRVLLVINRSITWASRVAGLVLLVLTLGAWLPRVAPRALQRRRCAILFLFVALALGPGLLVNSLIKENSGRARPVNVTEFGGESRFTRAWVPADQCRRNCAFVSGHVAVGAFLFAGWFVAGSARARRAWLGAGLAAGLTIGVGRMLAGSHFLSDVLVAMMLVWIVCALTAALILRPAAVPEDVPGAVQDQNNRNRNGVIP
ncbi:MAG TPA: phosphatase PAP2 family protein [Burkholderiaceae bacterium]|nr:phosphatase PAP2 family protein [Burkholderiaceae bacterium]